MIGRDENEAPSAESDRLQRDAAVLGNSSVQVAVEVDRAGAKAGADEAATPKAAAAAAPSPASAPSPAPAPVPLTSTRARIYRATGVGKRVLSPCTCLAAINVVIVTLSAGFFLYNATTIIKDYVSQLDSPPVTVRVKFNELIDFPTSMVCSSVAGLPFGGQTAVRLVYFRPDELDTAECVMSFNESTPSSDVADCLDVFDDAFFENKTVKADSGDSEGGDFHCVVWGGLPGWSKVPELREHLNNILTVDIDTDWTLESEFEPVHFLGAHYFIYGEDEYLDESTSVNAALAIASAYGVVAASTFNTAGITKSSMSYLDEEGDRVDYNIFNVELSSAPLYPADDGYLSVEMIFADNRQIETRQTLPSFSVAFGSLGGWLGFLSDGWGLLSIVFMIEKIIMMRTGNMRQWAWTDSIDL